MPPLPQPSSLSCHPYAHTSSRPSSHPGSRPYTLTPPLSCHYFHSITTPVNHHHHYHHYHHRHHLFQTLSFLHAVDSSSTTTIPATTPNHLLTATHPSHTQPGQSTTSVPTAPNNPFLFFPLSLY
ncbi:hypothetical protein E2C01_064988 [Portunus trituberculatus]|uniref:Uncharacterized protein n=1 Tax=Portunus trituberculatus TaxID=210409 RepID=A0A5B7HKP1_PORTR|nr:hypothetical protein [Portunus trituberculatus]